VSGLVGYETLLLRELGYGGARAEMGGDFSDHMAALAVLEGLLAYYLLAGHRGDVMAARRLLTERLARMA
jgi:DNA repair protein RecO (recombination protein O)